MINFPYAGIHQKSGKHEYLIQDSKNTQNTVRVPFVASLRYIHEQRTGGVEGHLLYYKSYQLPFFDIGYVLIGDELSVKNPSFPATEFFVTTIPSDSGRNRVAMLTDVLEQAGLNVGDEIIYLGVGDYIVLGKKQDLKHLQKIGTSEI